jgi:hypothetical protein
VSVVPPRIDLLAEPVESAVLEGGPILVVLRLSVVTEAVFAQVSRVILPTLTWPAGIGVAFRQADEPLRVVEPTLPGFDKRPGRDLRSNESRRVVVDVSPFLQGVRHGQLTLEVLAATPFGRATSAAMSLEVAPAQGPAGELMAAVRKELAPGGGWVDWARGDTPSPFDLRPLAELGLLAFHGLLRRWRRERGAVAPEELAALGPKLLPERLAFLAERAWLLGNGEELARRIAEVRAVEPGLGWWMDDLEQRPFSWTGVELPAR